MSVSTTDPTISCTKVPFDPAISHDGNLERLFVECCRSCSFEYKFKLENGKLVTVLCGRPNPANGNYKALSYVWENTTTLSLKCRKCLEVKEVPMRDAAKLKSIIEFVRGGSRIWIDALSIDQADAADKAAQIMVMGDIYRHAEIVSVFLVEADRGAYRLLKDLASTSADIVRHYDAFAASRTEEAITKLAEAFSIHVNAWIQNLHRWRYWQRAWTFQEWAMAREIEISFENSPGNEGLSHIKNAIVEASTIIGHWRKSVARSNLSGTTMEDLLQQIQFREETGSELNAVRSLFPFEEFLVADNEEKMENLRSSTFLSSMPMAIDSGTYVTVKTPQNESLALRSVLALALNAMSTSKRQATYPADLVACWASACNINYEYDIDDTFAIALHKVIRVLRQRGIRVYNFLANTDSAETDVEFLKYAAAHRHSNSQSRGYLFGAPIFVGRADTVTHVLELLRQREELTLLPSKQNISLQLVRNANFKVLVPWSDKLRAMSAFRSIMSGETDGTRLFDAADIINTKSSEIEDIQLSKRVFVVVAIGTNDINVMRYCNAWAIIPSGTPHEVLFVARESLNGTLVLATYDTPVRDSETRPQTTEDPGGLAKKSHIIGYLNTSHQKDGTYLMKTDDKGVLDIVFRTADTPEDGLMNVPEMDLSAIVGLNSIPGWNIQEDMRDRVLNLQIGLEDGFFSLTGHAVS